MKRKLKEIGSLGFIVSLLVGCNVGNAPIGSAGNPDQFKAEIQAEAPMQQLRNAMMAPLPGAEREAKIAAIENKYHISRNDAMKNLPPVKFSNEPPPALPTGK